MVLLFAPTLVAAALLTGGGPRAAQRASATLLSEKPPQDVDLPTKAVWFATEAFGKAAALVRPPVDADDGELAPAPATLDEAVERLARDYDGTSEDPRPYFLTGKMDYNLYSEDCEFADPFVSFEGRRRFRENLENLAGGFIVDSSTRTLDTSLTRGEGGAPSSYETRLMVKLQLGLPWKPVLAWPWGVEHVIDPSTNRVVRHIEKWDVSAADGVAQLLKPGPPNGLRQGRRDDGGDGDGGAASPLGTMDPIAGPIVKAARALGLMAEEEADGWRGEPSEWANADSPTQALSEFSQQFLGGFKQWAAEAVATNSTPRRSTRASTPRLAPAAADVLVHHVPFCKKAKTLDAKGVKYSVVELDEEADGAAMRARLRSAPGGRACRRCGWRASTSAASTTAPACSRSTSRASSSRSSAPPARSEERGWLCACVQRLYFVTPTCAARRMRSPCST